MKLLVAILALLISTPVAAVPPPPPPAGYLASWKAIEALDPFRGHWNGTEVGHIRDGEVSRPAYRNVQRLGGKDVILVEEGVYDSDPKPFPQAFNIISFDVKAGRYVAYLPGYRLFTGTEDTAQLVVIERPDARTLSWSIPLADGTRRRTTVTVDSQNWRERIERVSPDGVAREMSHLDLVKASQH